MPEGIAERRGQGLQNRRAAAGQAEGHAIGKEIVAGGIGGDLEQNEA